MTTEPLAGRAVEGGASPVRRYNGGMGLPLRLIPIALLVCSIAPSASAQAPEPTRPPPGVPPADVAPIEEPPQAPMPQPPEIEPQAGETTAPAATERPQPAGLQQQVETVLAEKFPNIDEKLKVETTPEGMVEVQGPVPLLADKLAISDALTELDAAAVVVNRTAPAAPRRSDDAITRDVRRRLRAEEDLREYDIGVFTRNQRVYLTGKVPSFPAVETALREAAGVRGVRDVIVSRLETTIPR